MQSVALGYDASLLIAVLNQSEFILCLVDESGLLVACNDTTCQYAHRTRAEIIGKSIFDLRISFPVQNTEQWSELLSRIAAAGQLTVETELGKSTGDTFAVRFVLTLQEQEGKRYLLALGRRLPSETEPLRANIERESRWQKALNQMATHESVLRGDLSQALAFMTHTASLVFPTAHCHVWRLQNGTLRLFPEETQSSLPLKFIPLSTYPWLRRCLESVRSMNCLDAASDDAEKTITLALLKTNGIASSLWAPILVSGRCWGMLTFGSTQLREWQAPEFSFADQVANQVAHAVLSEERCRAEAEIARSRERYRSFVEMSRELMARIEFDQPIPLHLPDAKKVDLIVKTGYIADCNDAFAHFFGFEHAGQIRGARVRRLAPGWGKRGVLFHLVRNDCQVINMESVYRIRGGPNWLLQSFQGIIENGSLVRVWGTARDITDFKQAEEDVRKGEARYRAFVANSSEGIVAVDYLNPIPIDLPHEELLRRIWTTARISECNQAFAIMRGHKHRDEIMGRMAREVHFDSPLAIQTTSDFIRNGFHLANVDLPTRTADNSIRWFRYSMSGVVEDRGLIRTWATITDVTAQKRLEQDLRSLSSRRGALLEQERTRVAREIHDELGQQLTVLKFEAAAWESGKRAPVKGGVTGQIDSIIHTVRRIATELRPVILDQYGLGAAVEWQASEFSRRTGIPCQTEIEKDLEVNSALSTTSFRILQEALTNIARHAAARHVSISLRRVSNQLQLTVQDDGVGFDPKSARRSDSLGLLGMRERASQAGGVFSIHPVLAGGTIVAVSLPLTHPEAPQ